MHVDHAAGGEIEHLRPEDVTVGNHDAEIGLETAEAFRKDITDRTYRLEYR
jgi:hypothetical protein